MTYAVIIIVWCLLHYAARRDCLRRCLILNGLISSHEGRVKLAQAMTAPFRKKGEESKKGPSVLWLAYLWTKKWVFQGRTSILPDSLYVLGIAQ